MAISRIEIQSEKTGEITDPRLPDYIPQRVRGKAK